VLFELFPQLRGKLPWLSLGSFPTPVHDASLVVGAAPGTGKLWLKRDDLSSPLYGGNKVRLLEPLLARAAERGARGVYATGALGSSFVLATALHAPRAGLDARAICFHQELTADGEEIWKAATSGIELVEIAHWSLLPLTTQRVRRAAAERGEHVEILSQVGLSSEALFGYVGAGLELAQQIEAGECPLPERVVLPIGSAATSAGLLAGLSLARSLGVLPGALRLCAVRIAPWPLSRRGRVVSMAEGALRRLAELTGRPEHALPRRELLPLELVTDQLGAGYAVPTAAGQAARATFARAGLPVLDDTYTAKAAAHVLALVERTNGPTLLWCTKSSATLR